jgi:uncharacterized protein YjaG (DUF416 family)
MSYVRYDEQEIIRKLDQLHTRAKVAFAAACAERQVPGYVAFSRQTGRGEPHALIDILERVWRDVLGDKMLDDEIQRQLARCMALIPQEDEGPWVNEQAYAEDAASAVVYALRARTTGESQEAAYAARVAYEALDHHVINRLGVEDDDHVLAHPVVQAELAHQHRDLDELLGASADLTALLIRLRDRASTEAATFFGPIS